MNWDSAAAVDDGAVPQEELPHRIVGITSGCTAGMSHVRSLE